MGHTLPAAACFCTRTLAPLLFSISCPQRCYSRFWTRLFLRVFLVYILCITVFWDCVSQLWIHSAILTGNTELLLSGNFLIFYLRVLSLFWGQIPICGGSVVDMYFIGLNRVGDFFLKSPFNIEFCSIVAQFCYIDIVFLNTACKWSYVCRSKSDISYLHTLVTVHSIKHDIYQSFYGKHYHCLLQFN